MNRLMIAGLVGLATTAYADETVTFDGPNTGGWSYFGNPFNTPEVIEPAGGNPGAFLLTPCDGGIDCLDTFAPRLRTYFEGEASPFVGNYREMGVTGLGTDLIQINNATTGERPLTVMLRSDTMDTPDNEFDDTLVYLVGPENIPNPGEGWKSYDFEVPSDAEGLPAGWKVTLDSPLQGDEAWNAVIERVDQVIFFYGDPDFFFIFQQWAVGADNLRITTGGCDADCNGDGNLDILDFVCFQNEWNAQSEAGDCDGNGEYNVLDFVCYQNLFSAGCN